MGLGLSAGRSVLGCRYASGLSRVATTSISGDEHRGMKLANVRHTFTSSAIQITSVAMASTATPYRSVCLTRLAALRIRGMAPVPGETGAICFQGWPGAGQLDERAGGSRADRGYLERLDDIFEYSRPPNKVRVVPTVLGTTPRNLLDMQPNEGPCVLHR